jgi:esterase
MRSTWDSRTPYRCTNVSWPDYQGMKLFYRKSGSGPPLVILHGLYGSSDNWITFSKRVEDSFTVYLPDQRNHGCSPHDNVHDYNSMSDDLFELAKDLNLEKIFLAGHSMGGKTAVAFALKWPEMVNGLLIADVSPFENGNRAQSTYNQHLKILDAINSINISLISTREEAEKILEQKKIPERERGLILKNLHRKTGNEFEWKLNAGVLRNNLEKIMEGIAPDIADNLPVSGFPVIFLKAGDSDYLPLSDFSRIRNVFPAAELVTVSGAGHWIQADKPDDVAMQIKRLLD